MNKNILIICTLSISLTLKVFAFNQEEQYNKVNLQTNLHLVLDQYQKIYDEGQDTIYGQLSLMKLAQYNFFKRDYKKSLSYIKKIHHPKIEDKQYWLAKAYLKLGKLQQSIISSQIFIAESDDVDKIENAYFLIAEAYLQQKYYKKAFNTLESLRTSKYINNHIPLLHYEMGFCKEAQGKYEQALIFYKKLKQDFPYHQYCYLAEDRIFNLTKEKKIAIDFSEINNFRKDEPVKESKAATGEDLKIFLQVGAFSSEDSAKKIGKKIKVVGYDHIIFSKIKNGNKLFVVAAGPFDEDDDLKIAMQKLKKNDINSYVIKRY